MWHRSGSRASSINWYSAGSSLRRVRSPLAPIMTNRQGSALDLRTRCSLVMVRDSRDRQPVVNTFPAVFGRPTDRKNDSAAGREPGRIEVGEVDAEAAVLRRRVADRAPAVAAPMDRRSREE